MSVSIPLVINIEEETVNNSFYREVIYTSPVMQLVLMSLRRGEVIPEEVHTVDQFVRVEKGEGLVSINGRDYIVSDGSAVIIPAGSSHYFANVGKGDLKLYTIYAPPEHSPSRAEVIDASGTIVVVRE